ncbi:hypothetical protein HYPSUDRAFT_983931 [Hypholoma sublateritium FD-334 SS-4]|uniref:Elongin-A n=1 Tax=Hypholoma sublateritium (strain FD-334 SS-4) TaxID=945553 RepID=A0A0D2PEP5_HYPSF|nr:hypothetical protein HYPSUDRAFT_983931 [Hypholoma sublateritium FD-334 SS-4]
MGELCCRRLSHCSTPPATMDIDPEQQPRRVPTLVQLCQRAAVALANADTICSLGDGLPYPLVKPILERCSIEQLSRLEQASPHLQRETAEIWKDLCFRKYRMTAEERHSVDDVPQDPDSWRFRYFALEEAEARRVDELGSRLRSQRMEADERKKEKEVKYTDRGLPDPKRARTGSSSWGTAPRKSLFQQTRNEASRYQRALNSRVLPPPPPARAHRVLPPPAPASSSSSSRVTVNTVVLRRPQQAAAGMSSASGPAVSGPSTKAPVALPTYPANPPRRPPSTTTDRAKTPPPPSGRVALASEPAAARKPPKKDKDPMSCLFVPKRTPQGQVRRPV